MAPSASTPDSSSLVQPALVPGHNIRTVLQIADKVGVDVEACDATIPRWLGETDVTTLAQELDRESEGPVDDGEA
jgi:hypothetical protein